MTKRERKLLEDLKNYTFMKREIERLEARLGEMVYNVIANYGFTGGSSGGFSGSKVESLSLRRMEAVRELERKLDLIRRIDYAIQNAGLDSRERDLVLLTIRGETLSSYARKEHIYKSYVYKIRENALKKMVKYTYITQNGANRR